MGGKKVDVESVFELSNHLMRELREGIFQELKHASDSLLIFPLRQVPPSVLPISVKVSSQGPTPLLLLKCSHPDSNKSS